MDFFDVLDNYKSSPSLTSVAAFFNSRYIRVDPSTLLYKSILTKAHNLKSQVCHYDSSFDDCIDSTSEIYVSYCGEELRIFIDTGASNLITPNASYFDGEIHKSVLSSLKQVNGTTPVCGQGNIDCWVI